MKPCIFCGSNASNESMVNPKVKSWVLKPTSIYPMCDSCIVLNENGDENGLISLICSKWESIRKSRDEEKKTIRELRRASRSELK